MQTVSFSARARMSHTVVLGGVPNMPTQTKKERELVIAVTKEIQRLGDSCRDPELRRRLASDRLTGYSDMLKLFEGQPQYSRLKELIEPMMAYNNHVLTPNSCTREENITMLEVLAEKIATAYNNRN